MYKKPRTRLSGIGRSVNCELEKDEVAATHRSSASLEQFVAMGASQAWQTRGVERGSSGGFAEGPFQHVNQSWCCSKVENVTEGEGCDGLAHG